MHRPLRRILRPGLALLLAGALALAYLYRDRLDATAVASWVDAAGAAGVLAFFALYAAATVLFLPGSIMTIAGGALFGPVLGTIYSLVGATLGATAAFLVSRHLLGDRILRRHGDRVRRLVEGIETEGWRFVAFARLVPLVPFNVLNYALGLTRIRTLPYVAASFVAMSPGAFAYTWLGYAGREALAGGEQAVGAVLVAIGLIAAVAYLPRLVRRLRAKPD